MSSPFPPTVPLRHANRLDDDRPRTVLDIDLTPNYSSYATPDSPHADDDENLQLRSQTLNADGTPKRPMNAFMIFARRRRPQVSAQNQMMRTGEISKILSKEWSTMPMSDKQFYLDQAKKLKENFNSKYPDYVYRRRPNNSRKKRRTDAAPYDPTLSPHALPGEYDDEYSSASPVDGPPHPHGLHHGHPHHHLPTDNMGYRLPNPTPTAGSSGAYHPSASSTFSDYSYYSQHSSQHHHPRHGHPHGHAQSVSYEAHTSAPPVPVSSASFTTGAQIYTPATDESEQHPLWPGGGGASSASTAGASSAFPVKLESWAHGHQGSHHPHESVGPGGPTLRLSARRGHPLHPLPLPLLAHSHSRPWNDGASPSPSAGAGPGARHWNERHWSDNSPSAHSHHGSRHWTETSPTTASSAGASAGAHARNWSDGTGTTAATTTGTSSASLSPPSSAGSGAFPPSSSSSSSFPGSGSGTGPGFHGGGSAGFGSPGTGFGTGFGGPGTAGSGAGFGSGSGSAGGFQTLTAPFYPSASGSGSASGTGSGTSAAGPGVTGAASSAGLGGLGGGGGESPSTASASSSSSYYSQSGPQRGSLSERDREAEREHGRGRESGGTAGTSSRYDARYDTRYSHSSSSSGSSSHHGHLHPHTRIGPRATLGSTLAPLALSPANVQHGSLWVGGPGLGGRAKAEV